MQRRGKVAALLIAAVVAQLVVDWQCACLTRDVSED
jgi:hypothetical protein